MTEPRRPSQITLIRRRPAGLPEVLDALIVGGGPGGTMTAFRAKELGLAALVLDYDDVLKRIRDYSKDKLILPDFGGGDQMRFPKGGELASLLHFAPIDKDEMHRTWRSYYGEHGVPVQIGIELTGLTRMGDGVWQVKAWDHNLREETAYFARHVVLAIGRGVPRRFDIPGNTDGIAFRLDDPAHYVGEAALVIGGGTSAAEAVIAISNAKAAAEDPSTVFWSYRGTKLPRVSKALAEVFFEAYLGNGNIRYCPLSEPAAVVTGEDRRDYLAIRIERRSIPGRPNESLHLEFPKGRCIACIGEDIPEAFLASLGVPMATDAEKGRKRMLVTPLLETVQPNVYMCGDMLSQAYFETDDFAADPATYRDIKHRGNIKSALRDGVLVAEVIAQKLAGKREIRVDLVDAEPVAAGAGRAAAAVRGPEAAAAQPAPSAGAEEEPPTAEVAPAAAVADRPAAAPAGAAPGEPAAALGEAAVAELALSLMRPAAELLDSPPAASFAPGRAVEDRPARLVRLLPGGVEENEYPLARGGTLTIGRADCDLTFPDDSALSDRHASLVWGAEGPTLRDDGGATGVFLRARAGEHTPIEAGAIVRAGRQFLVLAGGELRHFDLQGQEVGRYPVEERAAILGRDAPDVVLDAKDLSLSRRHLSVLRRDGQVLIKDLKSVNGTYVKVKTAAPLADGDEIKVGRQTFLFTTGGGAQERPPSVVFPAQRPEAPAPAAPAKAATPPAPAPAPAAAPAAPPKAPSPAAGAAPAVTFQGLGKTFPVAVGQTLCDVAEAHGVVLNAECHAGVCGSDPIRIVAGAEHLSALGDGESETLEELCNLEPGPCRLACMVKVKGPVVVEIVKGS
jgi:pSer/pThr/pTyr-binding forkhead associated (FHA) protein/thioredoxin reductase/ferredoxin